MRPHAAGLAIAGLLAIPCSGQPSGQPVKVVPLRGAAASLHWTGAQFVQADAQGNVYLLRGNPLEVYPITRLHDLGEPERVDGTLPGSHLLDAVLSPGGEWALLSGGQVSLVAGGHLARLPALPWLPLSIGFLRGDPVVTVTPPRLVAGERSDDPKAIPLLLSIGHDAWETEATEATLHAPDRHFELLEELASRSARVLAEGPGGLYLLARKYAYRIELRRLGRPTPLEELRLGKGEVILEGGAAPEQRLAEHVRRDGMDMGGGKQASAFRGVAAILALTHGPGGRLYVLLGPGVAADGHCALDRIEWDARRVERVALGRPCAGNQSMAAGKDGLYIASYDGQGDRFFLAWDTLDAATWTPVREAHFRP